MEQRDEEIRFIDAPTDGRVGMNMLHVLAKEEAGEAWPPREPSLGQAGKEARGPGALETAALEGALRLVYAAMWIVAPTTVGELWRSLYAASYCRT